MQEYSKAKPGDKYWCDICYKKGHSTDYCSWNPNPTPPSKGKGKGGKGKGGKGKGGKEKSWRRGHLVAPAVAAD